MEASAAPGLDAVLHRALSRAPSPRSTPPFDQSAPSPPGGLRIAPFDAAYFEASPLDSTDRTLQVLATALIVGAVLATLVATFFGFSTSRRLLRPLSRVADAAADIASGGLDTRLEEENDPDLNRLACSFNDMADAWQNRIDLEQPLPSAVSHDPPNQAILGAHALPAHLVDLHPIAA